MPDPKTTQVGFANGNQTNVGGSLNLHLGPAPSAENNPTAKAEISKTVISFFAANPLSTDHLALGAEARDIEERIRESSQRDAFDFKTTWATRTRDLIRVLNQEGPTVVHFSGHGDGAPGLVLDDGLGGERLVSGEALASLFSAFDDTVRLVVLNACYSQEQAEVILEHVGCVVGMGDSIDDETARVFAATFYGALAFGKTFDRAFRQGLAAIKLDDLPDEDVPVLRFRADIDPTKTSLV